MQKTALLIGIFLASALVSIAQLPELKVKMLSPLSTSPMIAKARVAYDKGDYKRAATLLYAELDKGKFSPDDFLLFANVLNTDGKSALAKEFYNEYTTAKNNVNINKQIAQLYAADNAGLAKEVVTKNSIANPTLNYGRIYTENQGNIASYTYTCDGSIGSPERALDKNTDLAFAKITYFDNAQKAIVSLIDTALNSSKLYYLYLKKGKWTKPKQIFDGDEGNFAFPSMDQDNNALYFASDRKGGLGGYDIYVSIWNGESFENPIHLGNEINSAGNDINPTKAGDWLYFSSNGHIAVGGYDLYKHKKLDGNTTVFLNARELNTTKNEYGVLPLTATTFYVTRQKGSNNQLLYLEKNIINTRLRGTVIDESNDPIAGAHLLLTTKGISDYVTTDSKGNYSYATASSHKTIQGLVVADGYEQMVFEQRNATRDTLRLVKVKPIEIIKEVIRIVPSHTISGTDSAQQSAQPTISEVSSQNTTDNQPTENVSNAVAKGSYYVILSSMYDYAEAYDFLTEWLPQFEKAEILEYENNLYRIALYAGTSEEEARNIYNEAKEKRQEIWILRPAVK